MVKKNETPLIYALEAYRNDGKIQMHMPGHKGGQDFPQWFIENFVKYDLTEIPGLDNLHNPESVIKKSMDKCSEVFGARKSFYLVNGSTSGIHAMLMSALEKGDKLLVQRDCHQSVINGLILFGIQPIFIMPEYNEAWHVKTPASLAVWEKAVLENPGIKGALITSPDYFGFCSPLEDLSDMMHKKGKILLVDEAHGAHFVFSKDLPLTALEQGADLCVQSLHKTLPALTQAAILHIGNTNVPENRIKLAVSMLTTTSPSYPIMASMEYAVDFAQKEGASRYGKLINMLNDIKSELNKMRKLKLFPDEMEGVKRDPTRIVIYTSYADLSGYELYKMLDEEYGVVAEMADESHVVFITTTADKKKDLEYLKNSLLALEQKLKASESQKNVFSLWPIQPGKCIMPELSIYLKECRDVLLNCSEGLVSARMITPYPPGIPLLCPGEIITKEHIHIIGRMLMHKVEVHGLVSAEKDLGRKIKIFG